MAPGPVVPPPKSAVWSEVGRAAAPKASSARRAAVEEESLGAPVRVGVEMARAEPRRRGALRLPGSPAAVEEVEGSLPAAVERPRSPEAKEQFPWAPAAAGEPSEVSHGSAAPVNAREASAAEQGARARRAPEREPARSLPAAASFGPGVAAEGSASAASA